MNACRKTDKNISPVNAMAFGASARAIAASSFLPFTVVKTRFEVGLSVLVLKLLAPHC